MFWKKTTSEDKFFEYETSDKRESFRLASEILGPIAATYKNRIAKIIDISAGGISFECTNCHEGETGELRLELPIKTVERISLPIKILKITGQTSCHSKFTKIHSDEEEKIHRYILTQQIAVKRRSRSSKKNDFKTK